MNPQAVGGFCPIRAQPGPSGEAAAACLRSICPPSALEVAWRAASARERPTRPPGFNKRRGGLRRRDPHNTRNAQPQHFFFFPFSALFSLLRGAWAWPSSRKSDGTMCVWSGAHTRVRVRTPAARAGGRAKVALSLNPSSIKAANDYARTPPTTPHPHNRAPSHGSLLYVRACGLLSNHCGSHTTSLFPPPPTVSLTARRPPGCVWRRLTRACALGQQQRRRPAARAGAQQQAAWWWGLDIILYTDQRQQQRAERAAVHRRRRRGVSCERG